MPFISWGVIKSMGNDLLHFLDNFLRICIKWGWGVVSRKAKPYGKRLVRILAFKHNEIVVTRQLLNTDGSTVIWAGLNLIFLLIKWHECLPNTLIRCVIDAFDEKLFQSSVLKFFMLYLHKWFFSLKKKCISAKIKQKERIFQL